MNSAPATVAIPGHLVGTWKADPVHSEIAFYVRHLMVSKARRRFTSYEVTIVAAAHDGALQHLVTERGRAASGGARIAADLRACGN